MKNYKLLTLIAALVVTGSLSAQQYDDLYYNPDKDKTFFKDYNADKQETKKTYTAQNEEQAYRDTDEDDAYYDDYDYYYSSRVRRFHRPFYGFNFFDPVYVDMSYYDPFLSPGATVLIYDDVFAFNNWYGGSRWNRWNNGFSWGIGFSPWSYGYNSWNNFGWNSFGPSYYGYNNYGYGYNYNNGFYCPPTWGSGYVYNTVENIRNNTVYGPRTSGGARIPREDGREIRRDANTNDGTLTPRTSNRLPGERINIEPRERNTTDESQMSGRAKAQSERRQEVERTTITPRESAPRRNYNDNNVQSRPRTEAPPRTFNTDTQRSSTREINSGSTRSSGSDRSSGSSSAPRSSSGSRRGGN